MNNIKTIFCIYDTPDPDAVSLNNEMITEDYGNVLSYVHGREDDAFQMTMRFTAENLAITLQNADGEDIARTVMSFRDIRDHVEMYLGTIESMQRISLSDAFAIASMDELRRSQHNDMADILREKLDAIGVEISPVAPKESHNFYRDVTTIWIENLAYSQEKINKPVTRRRGAFAVLRRTGLF